MASFADAYENKAEEYQVQGRKPYNVLLAQVKTAQHRGVAFTKITLNGDQKDLFNDRLNDMDFLAVVDALEGDEEIDELNACCNTISDVGLAGFPRLATTNMALTKINLRSNNLGVKAIELISDAMRDNPSWTSLNLNGNQFGEEGGLLLADMLQVNTRLQHLDVGNTEIGTQSVIAFAYVLRENNTLQTLKMENPRLFSKQEETTFHIARMLEMNSTLTHLDLSKHGIRDYGASTLSAYLLRNRKLRRLGLRCNNITMNGVVEIAKYLTPAKNRLPTVTALDLSNNRIRCDGAIDLGRMLETNQSIQELNLGYCGIEDDGLSGLADSLQQNRKLWWLRLWGNDFGPESSEKVQSLLDTNPFLSDLDFKPYTVDGVIMFQKVESEPFGESAI